MAAPAHEDATPELAEFRADTRAWLAENCPPGARGPGPVSNGSTKIKIEDADTNLWLERMVERGWTVPNWPEAYGGGGLMNDQYLILLQEMAAISARPALSSFGTSMIGPTLLEFGDDDQKARHLPRIARAEVEWCQGYSEPGSGSDLASLATRAVDAGDHYVINGQKIWTSGAHNADWMFCLVRTDPDAPKHEGISFVLLPMDQAGRRDPSHPDCSPANRPSTRPSSTDAVAKKDDLVGELNKGWTVGKRLLAARALRHGEPGVRRRQGRGAEPGCRGAQEHRRGAGQDRGSRLSRSVLKYEMDNQVFRMTQRRAVEESESGTPGAATSIFKVYGSELQQQYYDLMLKMRGTRGFPQTMSENDQFEAKEIADTKQWLYYRAASIYSGSNEVQRNIIAKRVLGLPD